MTRLVRFGPAMVLLVGCVLLAGVEGQTSTALAYPLASLPIEMPDHVSAEQAISEDELRIAGVSDYVARQFYRDSVPAFSIYVGYYAYQTHGKTIHSPKNCLPGSGWRALRAGTDTVGIASGSFVVNRFLLTDGERQALVYYWYQGRGRVAYNEYMVKWDLLRDAAITGRTEEALVRIVVPIGAATVDGRDAPDGEAAEALAASVAAMMIPAVDGVLPPWSGRTRSANALETFGISRHASTDAP